MKVDFIGFSIEPEQDNLLPVLVSSSSAPLGCELPECGLAARVMVKYNVIDNDKMMQSFETEGRTYITSREMGGYFKAAITFGNEVAVALPVSIETVNFGFGEYNVTYLVSDQKEDKCKKS